MALKIITKKRYQNNLKKIVSYLVINWNKEVAEKFLNLLFTKYELLSTMPNIGVQILSKKNVRSILITKHNKVYYRVEKGHLIILNIIDTRRNPKKDPLIKPNETAFLFPRCFSRSFRCIDDTRK
jgi:plasmid stabilization system protein ParE